MQQPGRTFHYILNRMLGFWPACASPSAPGCSALISRTNSEALRNFPVMPSTPDVKDSLLERQADWLKRYRPALRVSERGSVVSVGDSIAWISGLPSAAMDDILSFEDGSRAMVFDLTQTLIGAVLLHETEALGAGTRVELTGRPLSIAAGDSLLGCVIDPLGTPLDGGTRPTYARSQPLEVASPPIVARDFVHTPLYTGIKIVDTLIPIGKGQRQLLIGDEGLGPQLDRAGYSHQSAWQGRLLRLCTDWTETLHGHQYYRASARIRCPGVHHGCRGRSQQSSGPATSGALCRLRRGRVLDATGVRHPGGLRRSGYPRQNLPRIIPAAASSAGTRSNLATFFPSTHASWNGPPAEMQPTGAGSMTALPIVETQQGEIAAYIPTNLISITDGQIYLEQNLFSGGFRPAIDIRRSVSRIGGQAQHPRIKEEAGRRTHNDIQFWKPKCLPALARGWKLPWKQPSSAGASCARS